MTNRYFKLFMKLFIIDFVRFVYNKNFRFVLENH